jgi:hypothetical protein
MHVHVHVHGSSGRRLDERRLDRSPNKIKLDRRQNNTGQEIVQNNRMRTTRNTGQETVKDNTIHETVNKKIDRTGDCTE